MRLKVFPKFRRAAKPLRSAAIKRRMKLNRRKYFSPRALNIILFRAAVAGVFLLLIFGLARLISGGEKIRASAETVAAFRAPHRAFALLYTQAETHNIPFAELFTVFCAENAFFPEKAAAYDLSALERLYVKDFDKLKRKYASKSIAPYIGMYQTLFTEIERFPIPADFDSGENSFMYGDGWGGARNFEGDKSHKGADIYDRENIRGRVPVVSMTGGTVRAAGWDDKLGYHVYITTEGGTAYLYAHLDGFADNIAAGQPVIAGQLLGRMGDSGSVKGVSQVHLHIGISPKADFSKGEFWINPYPLLRFIEEINSFGAFL